MHFKKNTNSSCYRATKVKVKSILEQDQSLEYVGRVRLKRTKFNLLSSDQAYQVIYAEIAWT